MSGRIIRNADRLQILKMLEQAGLVVGEFAWDQAGDRLRQPNGEYYFTLKRGSNFIGNDDDSYHLSLCPGSAEHEETYQIYMTREAILKSAEAWVESMVDDNAVRPELERYLFLMHDAPRRTGMHEGERFSEPEIQQMRSRIDALEAFMRNHAGVKADVETIHAKMEELRASLPTQKPSAWQDQVKGAIATLLITKGGAAAASIFGSAMKALGWGAEGG